MNEGEARPQLEWAQFVRLAWTSVFCAIAKMKLLFFVTAICWVGLGFAERWALGVVDARIAEQPTSLNFLCSIAVVISDAIIETMLLVPVAVAVHRFILLDEVSPGLSVLRQACIQNFFFWAICIDLTFGVFAAVCGLASWILCAAVLVVLFARTLLIFPAVATEVPASTVMDRLEVSWASSRGLFWATFLIVVVAGLPLWLVSLAPQMVALGLAGMHGSSLAEWAQRLDWEVISSIADDLVHPLLVSILAAVASWIYLWTQQHPHRESASGASPEA